MRWKRDGDGYWDLYGRDGCILLSYIDRVEKWTVLDHNKLNENGGRVHILKAEVPTWQQLRKKLELEYILLRGER